MPQDAAFAFSAGNGLRRALGIHGIVTAGAGVGAIVLILQTHAAQQRHNFLLQRQTRVVTGKRYHCFFLHIS